MSSGELMDFEAVTEFAELKFSMSRFVLPMEAMSHFGNMPELPNTFVVRPRIFAQTNVPIETFANLGRKISLSVVGCLSKPAADFESRQSKNIELTNSF